MRSFELVVGDVGGDDVGAFGDKGFGDGAADALPGGGHQRDFVLQSAAHAVLDAFCSFNAARLSFCRPSPSKFSGSSQRSKLRFARRPFAVEHGKPGIVAIAALGDHVLAERAFVDEAVAQRGAPGGGIERIAFPFVAPVAERLENVTRQQVLGFGAERRALQRRRIEHVADLDHPMLRHDPQQRHIADGAIGR